MIIRKAQETLELLEWTRTYPIAVYDINLLGKNINIVKIIKKI
jgi:hypothetical protein